VERMVSLGRALAVWLLIIGAEFIQGILRGLLLLPLVGDFQARQISVFTGSILILGISWLLIRWIEVESLGALLATGLLWLVLTVLFELALGRLVMQVTWERLLSDYDIRHGGLLPFGLIIMTLSPLIAARLRGIGVKRQSNGGLTESSESRLRRDGDVATTSPIPRTRKPRN
jgi:hypothetical protein